MSKGGGGTTAAMALRAALTPDTIRRRQGDRSPSASSQCSFQFDFGVRGCMSLVNVLATLSAKAAKAAAPAVALQCPDAPVDF